MGAAAAVAVTALVLHALPADAEAPQTIGLRLVDSTTSRTDDPRARSYIVDHVPPATTIRRQVEVRNDTGQPRTIALYAAAADVGGGEFRFGDDRAANELTSWTTVSPPSLQLDAGAKGEATVTIAVPAGATSGERYAVVWAQVADASSRSGILAVNRVGVRIYLSVGPGDEPATDFAITSLQAGGAGTGARTVTASVRNTGGRALDLSGYVLLSHGPAGRTAGPFPAQLGPTLGIGEAEPARVSIDSHVPGGSWDAEIVLRSGVTVRTATARLTFASPSPSASRRATTRNSSGRNGGVVVTLVAVGVLTLLVTLARRRRRSR
ncbi:MAG TPA: hypothetical protein VFA96_07180 [Nocardioides sp.]|nr:hypothetical protein [Nocardioides sp.]